VTLSNDNLTDSGATDSALQTLPLLRSRPELVEQDTADKLKDELRKLKSEADKLKHDLLISTGTKSAN